MCGRFVESRPIDELVDEFDVDDVRVPLELLPEPRYNISPQADVVAIRDVERPLEEGGDPVRERRLALYRWGLVPSWAKDVRVGARSFNARAETLADKPMFRTALAKRRCIIPADAFYEWERLGSGSRPKKQPWCFQRADSHPIAFAGLYEVWKVRGDANDPTVAAALGLEPGTPTIDGDWLLTCTIVTTGANELMAPIHDRMPVVLEPEDIGLWLAPRELDENEVAELLVPCAEDVLVAYEVGTEVGNSRAEGPELVAPLASSPSAPAVANERSPAWREADRAPSAAEEGRLF